MDGNQVSMSLLQKGVFKGDRPMFQPQWSSS